MTSSDDNAPPPQVLPDTHLTICLHCGYSLRGLPAGHNCPECGNPSDRESARQEVLDIVNQPMLKLGWRMLQFWKPLPAGWWWTLARSEDRRRVRRRTWRLILSSWFLLLVLSCFIVTINRKVTVTIYGQPQGEPEKRQVRARGSSSGAMSSVSVHATPGKPGWVVVTERTEEVVVDFRLGSILQAAILVALVILLTWGLMRWLWLPICLATGPRKKSPPELHAIKTVALYQIAPMLMILSVEMFLFGIHWALYTSGVGVDSFVACLAAVGLLQFGLLGATWVAAIRSDLTRHIFQRRFLPIVGIMLAAGPGGVLAMSLIGALMETLVN